MKRWKWRVEKNKKNKVMQEKHASVRAPSHLQPSWWHRTNQWRWKTTTTKKRLQKHLQTSNGRNTTKKSNQRGNQYIVSSGVQPPLTSEAQLVCVVVDPAALDHNFFLIYLFIFLLTDSLRPTDTQVQTHSWKWQNLCIGSDQHVFKLDPRSALRLAGFPPHEEIASVGLLMGKK